MHGKSSVRSSRIFRDKMKLSVAASHMRVWFQQCAADESHQFQLGLNNYPPSIWCMMFRMQVACDQVDWSEPSAMWMNARVSVEIKSISTRGKKRRNREGESTTITDAMSQRLVFVTHWERRWWDEHGTLLMSIFKLISSGTSQISRRSKIEESHWTLLTTAMKSLFFGEAQKKKKIRVREIF